MTWAILDRDGWAFRYAYPLPQTLSQLANIELSHRSTAIRDFGDPISFKDLDVNALRSLTVNTLGPQAPTYSRDVMVAGLLHAAACFPYADVEPFEVSVQSGFIKEDDEYLYRYVKGAMKPADVDDERWVPPALTVALGQMPAPRPEIVAPPAPPESPTPTLRTQPSRSPSAPRGGVRQIIWDVADKLWEEAGKPMDAKTVLALRKTWYDVLADQHGVNRNTASCELGDWQKARLN